MTLIKSICANNIEQVQVYRNNGLQWPSNSYFFCFLHRNRNRNFEMADFLLENGCQFDSMLFTKSLDFNNIEILE